MIYITMDTNPFMHDVSLDEIARLLKSGAYQLYLLTSVPKELNKKTIEGLDEGIFGLKRLDWLKSLAPFKEYIVEEVYADDQFVEWLDSIEEHIMFVASGDRDLKKRIYNLHNPKVEIFDLTRSGRLRRFNPDFEPEIRSEIVEARENQQVAECHKFTEINEKNEKGLLIDQEKMIVRANSLEWCLATEDLSVNERARMEVELAKIDNKLTEIGL